MKKLFILSATLCLCVFVVQSQPNYPPAPPAPTNITAIEYFIDANPNFGSGTSLTGFTSSTNVNNFTGNVDLTGLTSGFHRIYFRSKDVDGKWSLTQNAFFDNYNVPIYSAAPPPSTNINSIEYFVDNNPNFGSGVSLTGFSPSPNVSNFNTNANITGLPSGFHRFYIRSKDVDGKWSLTQSNYFDNFNIPVYNAAPAANTNITQLEYFLDNNDLGFGNCTPITITPNTNISNLNANINITGLIQGVHRLHIRSKDSNGKWSLTNFSVFDNSTTPNYPLAPPTAPAIANMEYYIDTDPGFGNATALTVPGNTGDIANYSVSLNLSGSLSVGIHYLYIRSKQNPWSVTSVVPFNATSITPLTWQYVKAQLINKQTLVTWGTAQEANTKIFEIEHSNDGINFIKIGQVNAAGNSNSIKNYSFNHNNPITGFNYYRIKQIDNDDKYKYSAIVTVLKKDNIDKAIIAPNPVKDMLNVVEPSSTFITNAEVYSMEGKLILRKTINADIQVFSTPVNHLPSAQYILKINYKGTIKSYSFIKN